MQGKMENFQLLHVAVNFDVIEANIWHYTKNSFFPRILLQKHKNLTPTYDTILRGRSQTNFARFGFIWPHPPLHLHFLRYISLQKVNFLWITKETFFDQKPSFEAWWKRNLVKICIKYPTVRISHDLWN